MISKARGLVETGQFAAAVGFLGERTVTEIEDSPTLALLNGTALARLGRHTDGERWVSLALDRARERADHSVELRALNVRGVIALERGRIDEAAEFFMRALEPAKREGDDASIGRCSNNLGIIENLRGDYGRALGSYASAIAAFQQAGLRRGVAEVQHNIAITYRDLGELVKALAEADRAVEEADVVGDRALSAQTLAGRAEIRVLLGESVLARREVEQALATHRDLEDRVGEAEDRRILAATCAAAGRYDDAERMLRDVIEQSEAHGRPLLGAMARRDLAHLLKRLGRFEEASAKARIAQDTFTKLGAAAEVEKVKKLLNNAS